MLPRWRAGVRLTRAIATRHRVLGSRQDVSCGRTLFPHIARPYSVAGEPSPGSGRGDDKKGTEKSVKNGRAESEVNAKSKGDEKSVAPSTAEGELDENDPGAIGGFMRGLMGGRDVAAEDAFVAEAKEQGIDLPPPPPQHRADLVPIKRRKRKEDEAGEDQSIRDRLFSRFAGSPFMQSAFDAKERIAERIDESDNPVVNFFRNIYDRVFAENEMAMVVREIREDDKAFTVSDFLRDAEETIIPKILGAYLAGERAVLKELCTEDAYRMLNASIRERDAEGIIMDTNILDISEVELTAGKLLEDSPVLIVTFSAQQINCLRDRSGAVIEGSVDDIRAVYYVWAFVREIDVEEGVPTGGGMGDSEAGVADDSTQADAEIPGEKNGGKERKSDDPTREEPSDSEEATSKRDLPPWKMMEMVVRGAHSTI